MNKVVVIGLAIGIGVCTACQKKAQSRQSLRWDSLDTRNSRSSPNLGWGDDIDTTLVMDSLWVYEANAAGSGPVMLAGQDTVIADTVVAAVDTAAVVQQVHPWAVAGFMTSLAGLGLSMYTPLVCMAGIIFCGIALSRIRRNPEKFKGKRLATWGLIIAAAGLMTYMVIGVILIF